MTVLIGLAITSWLAFYASKVFCASVTMYFVLWAVFFAVVSFTYWVTADE